MYLQMNSPLAPDTPRHSLPHVATVRRPARPILRDGSHDFDFEIGTWRVRHARLVRPFTPSSEWVRFDGTSTASRIFNRGAVLVELECDEAGLGDGLLLRLYDPEARQWSISATDAAGGGLGQPQIGEFRGGRGEFYGQDVANGRTMYSRSVVSEIAPSSFTLEQSLSDDGGRSWELHAISRYTRTSR